MSTLRRALPLTLPEVAAVFEFVAREVSRLHTVGVAHGALTIDDIGVTRLPDGALEVRVPPARGGSTTEDVATFGGTLAAAVHASDTPRAGPLRHHLLDVAGAARAAALGAGASAAEVHDRLVELVRAHPAQPMRTAPLAAWARLVAWVAVLTATVVVLPRAVPTVSPPPVIEGWHAVRGWLGERDLATAVMGVLRTAVHLTALYLLATTVLSAVVHALPSAAAHRLAFVDRVTAASARRLVHTALGVGLTVGAVTTLRLPSPAAPAPSVATPTATPTATAAPTTTAATATASTHAVAAPVAPETEPEQTWTVEPGDHFWSIARRALDDAGLPTDEAAVRRFWIETIEMNRDRLVVPDDPDLLLTGQVLRLPPLPARGAPSP